METLHQSSHKSSTEIYKELRASQGTGTRAAEEVYTTELISYASHFYSNDTSSSKAVNPRTQERQWKSMLHINIFFASLLQAIVC